MILISPVNSYKPPFSDVQNSGLCLYLYFVACAFVTNCSLPQHEHFKTYLLSFLVGVLSTTTPYRSLSIFVMNSYPRTRPIFLKYRSVRSVSFCYCFFIVCVIDSVADFMRDNMIYIEIHVLIGISRI